MDYNNIFTALKNNNFTEEEYEKIISLCRNKIYEQTDIYYANQIYELNNDFIKAISKLHFENKISESLISFNIKFNYKYFIITLSNRQSYCSTFGGISSENNIHIVDTNNDNCYNLFGHNIILKFKNIINLDMTEYEIKNILNSIFYIYQPNELIVW
jgi:hypothetical protein